MSKNNLEQKAILIDLSNSLLSFTDWIHCNVNNDSSDEYANYHTKWHFNNLLQQNECLEINEDVILKYITNNLK